MSKVTYEEYLEKYGTLIYKNTGTSMLPLLRPGRDAFVIRAIERGEICRKWDVVLYKRFPESYVLHRIIRVHPGDAAGAGGVRYDILGDNCIGIERNIPGEAVLGVMTDVIRGEKKYHVSHPLYLLYVLLWCWPYRFRIAMKKIQMGISRRLRTGGDHSL